MTAIDTARAVLAKASLFDPTFSTPDLGIAVAWAEALNDTDQADALAVVTEHYQTQTRRLMPADVLAGLKRIRAERIRAVPQEPDYDGTDPHEAIAAIKAYRKAVGDGLAPVTVMHPKRDVSKLVTDTLEAMPQIPPVDYGNSRARTVDWASRGKSSPSSSVGAV